MSTDGIFLVSAFTTLIVLCLAFGGDPDLMDAIIHQLMNPISTTEIEP